MKFGVQTNWNMHLTYLNMLNSVVMFICPVIDFKHTFWTNLVQKILIARANFYKKQVVLSNIDFLHFLIFCSDY